MKFPIKFFSFKNLRIKDNRRFTPFRLESLNNTLVGCKIEKNGQINVVYDKESSKYSETEIMNAIKEEIIPAVNEIFNYIEGDK